MNNSNGSTGTILLALLVGIVLIAIYAISVYNSLIKSKMNVKEAFSDMDVQLKRRYDLIPNLIATVKGAANFESSTLEKVVQARQQAINLNGLSTEKLQAENALSGSLRQLFAVAESYPDLKSNQNFLALQEELAVTEDKILSSRRFYNGTVKEYNSAQLQFPTMLFAGLAQAKQEPFFELENPTVERENVKVEF
jgi:LemA protein